MGSDIDSDTVAVAVTQWTEPSGQNPIVNVINKVWSRQTKLAEM